MLLIQVPCSLLEGVCKESYLISPPCICSLATGFEEPISIRISKTAYFYNHSWVQDMCSVSLGELQILSWNSSSDTLIFLYPWSRGNFSNKELSELQTFFQMYFIRVTQAVHTGLLQFEYPFDIQMATGCELHSGKNFIGYVQLAIQGTDFLSLQNETWLPSPKGGKKAQHFCRLLNLNQAFTHVVQRLLSDTCPRFTLGVLDAGKTHLQRQVKPNAWLSSGPSPGPGHLLLVCHVSGFYPKPLWVMWMRGEQEQLGTQRGDFLPNADGTWYLRATLDVAAEEAAGLACRVKHSSLGGQDLVLYWGEHHSFLGLILAVMVALVLLIGLAFLFRKRW
uniref:Ig-like domain-containing protein n=1 Tax=Sciurus vulgaris TaxID=55149 RepID=A0A8D2ATS1_SCIVU